MSAAHVLYVSLQILQWPASSSLLTKYAAKQRPKRISQASGKPRYAIGCFSHQAAQRLKRSVPYNPRISFFSGRFATKGTCLSCQLKSRKPLLVGSPIMDDRKRMMLPSQHGLTLCSTFFKHLLLYSTSKCGWLNSISQEMVLDLSTGLPIPIQIQAKPQGCSRELDI